MEKRKKHVAIISFTDRGRQVNWALNLGLEKCGYLCRSYEKMRSNADHRATEHKESLQGNTVMFQVEEPVSLWARERFEDSQALIFIGAAGIAVRAIAPWIQDKWKDPAVVDVDEAGRFAIPLLSGHVGGANDLAQAAAEILKGVPVITTATDVNHRFAVDVFAVKNGLQIMDRSLAKEISAQILKGALVGMFSDYPLTGIWPEELMEDRVGEQNIWITRRPDRIGERDLYRDHKKGAEEISVLRLVPKIIHIGVGCRGKVPGKEIKACVLEVLRRRNCVPESVAAVASIDLKEKEPGLLELAEAFHVPFHTFTARSLKEVKGEFQESDFVAQVTGVGNVCERAALLSSKGKVICSKQVFPGVTVALAEEEWKGTF
ncbi:MAG: cobalt-precorrin 5A hydrolase [Hungatella sp.]|nr:cobalt-precorrin 5A hydrolase [Hungatella sp.]